MSSDRRLTIRLNPDAPVGHLEARLALLTRRVAYGLHYAPDGLTEPECLSGAVLTVGVPRQGMSVAFGEATSPSPLRFGGWLVGCALRDAVEAIQLFLDEMHVICFQYKAGPGRKELVETLRRELDPQQHRFHRKGLPEKMKAIQTCFSDMLTTAYDEEVRSLGRARNCVVHRGGVVGPADQPPLVVRWRYMKLFADGPTGRREVQLREMRDSGEELSLQVGPVKRSFGVGEHITFSACEFSEIAYTLLVYAMTMAKAVRSYGDQMGVPVEP